MSWWRRYLDLWIACALLCGLFVLRQGGVTLAEIGPQMRDFGTFVSAKLTEFASIAPAAIAEAVSPPPAVETPAPADLAAPAQPALPAPSLPNGQTPAPIPPAPLAQHAPGAVFAPYCQPTYVHCLSR